MAVEVVSLYTGNIASGASTISFDVVKGWGRVYAQVGTMSTAVILDVFAGVDGTTFYQVFTPVQTNTTSWIYQTHAINALVGTNGGVVPIYTNGCRYIQVRGTGVVSGGVAMTLICSD